MAIDSPRHCQPVDLAPEVLLLPGFDGDGADPFLVPVNALLLGGGPCLLVIPGAGRAPWVPALVGVADDVHWIVSARPAPTPDLRLALAACRHAVAIGDVAAGLPRAVGRFALLDPPTAPVRSRAVLDLDRHVLYSADAFGAPLLVPATDTDDLDDAYWNQAARLHTGWAGFDAERAAALDDCGIDVVVPAFGPILRGARRAAALAPGLQPPPSATSALYVARMEELLGAGC